MKRLGRWIFWLVIVEFLLFFAIGIRIRREMEQPRVHFVQNTCSELGRGSLG